MNPVELVAEDWRSIPQNNRYFILAGTILLGIDWVADHWGKVYTYFGFRFQPWFFSIGITLILLGFIFIIVKQFSLVALKTHYLNIYPIDKVNDTFSLISFNGYMILFDKRDKNKKVAYHVVNSGTATDLKFWGSEIHVDMSYAEAKHQGLVLDSPINVKVGEYKYDYAGSINTRG